MDRHFVTPSGRSVRVEYDAPRQTPNHDSFTFDLTVSSTATTGPTQVVLDAPPLTSAAYKQITGAPLNDTAVDELVVVAVLQAVDQDPLLVGASGKPFQVTIGPGRIRDLLSLPRLEDREIRRWLARRVYDEYSRADLDVEVSFDSLDRRVMGTTVNDLWRNAQVLGQEGYFQVDRAMGAGNYTLRPTAKLVREVERYGSAREDALSETDYIRALEADLASSPRQEEILVEYRRYVAANTRTEIASVFRAVAPLVEAMLRDVLMAKGCTRALPALGPIISELQTRGIGDTHLYSQLNHVLKFARDLEQHGASLGESVLRVACANAFELVPQIGAL